MKNIMKRHSRISGTRAQTALGVVILIAGIIILISALLAFVSISFLNSIFSFQSAQNAYLAAASGAEDATLQLMRNKDFPTGTYSIPVGPYTSSVTVSQNTPTAGLVTVTSVGTVNFNSRKIQLLLSVNSSTGAVDIVSWREVNFN